VAVLEAKRRHLQDEPEIARMIRERVNNYILDGVYHAEVVSHATATEQDVREAFERRSAFLRRLQSATVQTILLPDSAAASRVIELARNAPTLRDAILHSSAGLQVREETLSFPSPDPFWESLERQLVGLAPMSYGPPVRGPQGWLVYQLISKNERGQTFEDLPPEIQSMLQTQATELARERRLNELTDSLRKRVPVREYPERLKQIPWPNAAGAGPIG
jgi:hypothetical protein